LWFTETGSVTDPGGLVELYLEAARQRGAQIIKARASAIETRADGAQVRLDDGSAVQAGTVVLAAGAAAGDLARTLGYRIPFAAPQADMRNHTSHDRLEEILKLIVEGAMQRAEYSGAELDVTALAAIRATREATSSRIRRTCSTGLPLGSSSGQSSRFSG